MKIVAVIVPTYSQAGTLRKLFETVRATSTYRTVFYIFLHSTRQPVVEECLRLSVERDVTYFPYGRNREVSRTWNDGLLMGYAEGADVVILANDDVWVTAGDVDAVADAAMAHRDHAGAWCAGCNQADRNNRGIGFSFIAINPIALQVVGYLDENIHPCYFEDVDYHRRMNLHGLKFFTVWTTNVQHSMGTTVPTMRGQEIRDYRASAAASKLYYDEKWSKGNDHPFGDPGCSYYISSDNRHDPYPHHRGPGAIYASQFLLKNGVWP